MAKYNCLIVDDEPAVRECIGAILDDDAIVSTASNGIEALRLLEKAKFDVIICDVQMPCLSGLDVYRKLKSQNSDLLNSFMFCTGNVTQELVQLCQTQRIPYCQKPLNIDTLKTTVKEIVGSGTPKKGMGADSCKSNSSK